MLLLLEFLHSDPDIFYFWMNQLLVWMLERQKLFYELMHHSAHKHGKSVLMITHDPDEVKHYADRNIHLVRNQKMPWRCFNVHGTDVKGATNVD